MSGACVRSFDWVRRRLRTAVEGRLGVRTLSVRTLSREKKWMESLSVELDSSSISSAEWGS